jgi:hypothetical protein
VRKIALLLATVVIGSAALAVTPVASEASPLRNVSSIVPNGSFEDGSGTAATGWSLGTDHARSDDASYDGDHSLGSTATTTAASTLTVPVEPATDYRLSVWILKENGGGVAFADFNDIPGEAQIGVGEGDGAGEWVYSQASWNSGSATSVTLRLVTAGSLTGSIWFDHVVLAPLADLNWDLATDDTEISISATDEGPVVTELRNPGANWNWTPEPALFPLMSEVGLGGTTASPPVALPPVDVAINGSFEDGTAGAATGWATGTDFVRDEAFALAGTRSLRSDARTTAVASSVIAVQPYTTYRVSAQIYKNDANGVALVDMNDIPGEVQMGVGEGGGAGTWTYVEGLWSSEEATSLTLRTVVIGAITDDMWFDDIRVVQVLGSEPPGTAFGPNVVPNPSFELGTGATADDWSSAGGFARGSALAHAGTYSLTSTARSTAAAGTTIAVDPDTRYRLSGWIHKATNDGVAFIDMNDVPGESQIGVGEGAGGGTWTYVEGEWSSGSATSVSLRTVVAGSLTGDVWFDDLSLETMTAEEPDPPVGTRWVFDSAQVDTVDGERLTLTYVSSTPALELESVWWARPGSGPVEHRMTVSNLTGAPITVYPQESLQLDVEGDVNPVLWQFSKESGTPDAQGIYTHQLANDDAIATWTTPSGDWNANGFIPLVYLDAAQSHGLYVGWEWPDGRIDVTTSAAGSPSTTTIKAGVDPAFRTDVPAAGTFQVPAAYVGAYQGDVDQGSNSFKNWFFDHKLPEKTRVDPREPYAQMAEHGLGVNHDLASWGIDAMQWDYGWWPGSASGIWRTGEGDWRLGSQQYIDAIEDLGLDTWQEYGDYLESNDLEYTTYFLLHDGESTDPDALSSIGPNGHPEWFSSRRITAGYSADLGNEDAAAWIGQRLLAVMNDVGIDTYRSDFEPIATTSPWTNRHKYSTDVAYWNAVGFYEILDHLRANKPGFRYENNGPGGNMKDFATLSRSSVVNLTDTANYIDMRKVFYDSSFAIHPVQLMAPSNMDVFSSIPGEDDYGWRSIIMGAIMTATPTADDGALPYDEEQYAEEYYGMYRDKLRPLVRDADLFHILPRPDEVQWDGIQYFDSEVSDPDDVAGVAFLFKPTDTEGDTKVVSFKGLDPLQEYALTFEDRTAQNTVKTGAELMAGFAVTISEDRGSELVWISEAP